MDYSCILLSGGKGSRFENTTPKQYLMFAGKPMILYSLECMEPIKEIKEIVVVCAPDCRELIKGYIKDYNLKKKFVFADAGDTRQASVYSGLKASKYDNVIIHESARPLVTKGDFQKIIECEHENVTTACPIPYTVLQKDEDNFIFDILDRSKLINNQAPQKFNKEKLLFVHKKALLENKTFTEDSSMLFNYLDEKSYIIQGKSYNIKMTEYTDLIYGELLLSKGIVKD